MIHFLPSCNWNCTISAALVMRYTSKWNGIFFLTCHKFIRAFRAEMNQNWWHCPSPRAQSFLALTRISLGSVKYSVQAKLLATLIRVQSISNGRLQGRWNILLNVATSVILERALFTTPLVTCSGMNMGPGPGNGCADRNRSGWATEPSHGKAHKFSFVRCFSILHGASLLLAVIMWIRCLGSTIISTVPTLRLQYPFLDSDLPLESW